MLAAAASRLDAWYTWSGLLASVFVIAGFVWAIVKHETRSIMREVKPNGGDTDSNGDRTKRIEETLRSVKTTLDRHIGHSDAVEEEIFSRLEHLERR